MFLKVDEPIAKEVVSIVKEYPKLVDTLTDRNQADPYLIALAKVKKAVLVTQEGSANDSPKKMKISDMCGLENIRCIKLLPMFEGT